MSFNKEKYLVIRSLIDPKVSEFVFNYFLMKRQVADTMFKAKYISPFNAEWGVWTDHQAPNTYSHYGDIAMETLLLLAQPSLEKEIKKKLVPTYAYARIYKKGDILEKHTDRFSCEVSSSIFLGGEEWPIYMGGNKINLKPGDGAIYKGSEIEHWREPFKGNDCAQVFLHYNSTKTKGSKTNMFDTRKHLGLPSFFKNKTY